MACQVSPYTYPLVVRCHLKDGALLKTLADSRGETMSALVAKLIHDCVGERELTEQEKLWFDEHFVANTKRRKKADEMTAAGYYKHKRRGRPRKPGPRRGKKKAKRIRAELLALTEKI